MYTAFPLTWCNFLACHRRADRISSRFMLFVASPRPAYGILLIATEVTLRFKVVLE